MSTCDCVKVINDSKPLVSSKVCLEDIKAACILKDMRFPKSNSLDQSCSNKLDPSSKTASEIETKLSYVSIDKEEVELVEDLSDIHQNVDTCFEILLWLVSHDIYMMRLNIIWMNMDYERISRLCQTLCSNTSVTSLTLQESIQLNASYECYKLGLELKLLLQSNKTIQSIVLYGCLLQKEAFVPFTEGLRNNTTLKKLTLSKCIIEDGGIGELTKVLIDGHGSIEYLSLRATDLSKSIVAKFECCKYRIDPSAVALESKIHSTNTVPAVIRRNKVLQKLDLQSCLIGDEGAICLAEALYWNTTLVSLKLADNNITDKGMHNISKAISYHPTLEILNLSFNPNTTDTGIEHLLNALKTNDVLKKLYIPICNDFDNIQAKVKEITQYNDTIKEIEESQALDESDAELDVESDAELDVDQADESYFSLTVPRTSPLKGSKRRCYTFSSLEAILCSSPVQKKRKKKRTR